MDALSFTLGNHTSIPSLKNQNSLAGESSRLFESVIEKSRPEAPLVNRRFENWRSDKRPDFSFNPLVVNGVGCASIAHGKNAEQLGVRQYESATAVMEKAIGDAAIRYVYNQDYSNSLPGPLLVISQTFSERYLDLYEILVAFEMQAGLPMLSNAAGQLKNHGFTTEQIMVMQESCKKLAVILERLRNERGDSEDLLSLALKEPLGVSTEGKGIDQKSLIQHAVFMMKQFGGMSSRQIESQLEEVSRQTHHPKASHRERVLMEIRHRIGGDGSVEKYCPGALGQNPLAYLNVIKQAQPNNPEGQFRQQMYFVYMSNHLANEFLMNPLMIAFANDYLTKKGKGWRINPDFVEAMNARGPQNLPPVFRYGNQAALNKVLREKKSAEQQEGFYQKHPNLTLRQLESYLCSKQSQDAVSHSQNFRFRLTSRELLHQYGDFNRSAINPDQPLKYGTGAAVFHLKSSNNLDFTHPLSDDANRYLSVVEQLKIPVVAGLSGTMDQMMTMAGFVGIGFDGDEKYLLRLAMLAFMLPSGDHSAHEILQASKSFGMDYLPGPGFESTILPKCSKFLSILKEEQHLRGFEMPSYYLSN